ncbi:helix-turn-helix domain-containing protein [Lactobacillus gasseri]|jgi:transcriptional regulator with XRE-family HTH domain|uniref:helix-turn-helix domain-containing protein n=1 Tax=Lactobacillus gasseri TaxID=1596 RepID=UPI002055A19C|nr:helix-turn-helix transcriptional regulator [Lactobacillus gasseri]MDX5065595.1 helix-turn-helix transcriptional regulator [Lactobacillus gasseri]MDX5082312.1 helix-turn-helix transcriptional regulator [Lactobacillus gasseri]DAJ51932.1 MAG TPA: helix-turn-helix domain protein [Caudoviricetes sp.]
MKNRLKELRIEKGLTLADMQAKTNIDFRILENFEKGLENGIPNSLAIWQKLANFLEVPIEYLMGLNDDSKTLAVNDLNPAKEDAYERITDMLCEDEDDEDE